MASQAGPLNSAVLTTAPPPPRPSGRWKYLTATAIVLAWTWDVLRVTTGEVTAHPRFAVEVAEIPVEAGPVLPEFTQIASHELPIPPGKPMSHASSLLPVTEADGRRVIVAYWFAGSRESGPDVEIFTSRFDPARNLWSPPTVAVNRHVLALQLDFAVRRLGNSVGWVDKEGKVHLFAVATGLGGWSASRIVHLVSDDGGHRFSPLRVLPLSPWFNTSNLVRAPAIALDDGGALLPLYFEIGNKYPLALRISADGTPRAMVRMSDDAEALQPAVIALDGLRAVALLRDRGDSRTMKLLSTADAGRSWSDEGATNLANPNSSMAGARLPSGNLVAVVNTSPEGRHDLAIAASRTGHDWKIVKMIESGAVNEEFSYPALLVEGNRMHVTYTYKRQSIRHRIYTIGPAL